MAKFSFEEGGEGSGVRKRRRIVAAGETDPTRAEKRFEESEVEDDEGEEAIEEEEEEEEEGAIATENGDGIRVRVDPDLLDCSICFEPLRPPLYQVLDLFTPSLLFSFIYVILLLLLFV